MIKIFVYGQSGAGKDTFSNYLRDEYKFLKLRIAGTIKQLIAELQDVPFSKLEHIKRLDPNIRIMHQSFGDQYFSALRNRVKLLTNGETRDFEIIPKDSYNGVVVCDVREFAEVEILLEAGFTGVFLNRLPKTEYTNKHRSDVDFFDSPEFIPTMNKYPDLLKIIVLNDDDPKRNRNINELIDNDFTGLQLSVVEIKEPSQYDTLIKETIDSYMYFKKLK
jgi:hypothetical protein